MLMNDLISCVFLVFFIFILFIFYFKLETFFDIITRIRNCNLTKFSKVYVPQTNLSVSVCKVLKNEGFIETFQLNYLIKNCLFLSVHLKFKGLKRKSSFSFIKRVSRPGFRIYKHFFQIPIIEGGMGLAVLFYLLM